MEHDPYSRKKKLEGFVSAVNRWGDVCIDYSSLNCKVFVGKAMATHLVSRGQRYPISMWPSIIAFHASTELWEL